MLAIAEEIERDSSSRSNRYRESKIEDLIACYQKEQDNA